MGWYSTAWDYYWDRNASMYTSVETLHCSGVWVSLVREGLEGGGQGVSLLVGSSWVEHVYIRVHAYTCTYTIYVHTYTYLILKSPPHTNSQHASLNMRGLCSIRDQWTGTR